MTCGQESGFRTLSPQWASRKRLLLCLFLLLLTHVLNLQLEKAWCEKCRGQILGIWHSSILIHQRLILARHMWQLLIFRPLTPFHLCIKRRVIHMPLSKSLLGKNFAWFNSQRVLNVDPENSYVAKHDCKCFEHGSPNPHSRVFT